MKKRTVSFEPIDNMNHYSAIVSRSLVEKKEDPRAFTISWTNRSLDFSQELCDLGDSINLMPLVMYKQLGLGLPKPTSMRLLMADQTVKKLVGILYNVLVKVASFIFPADFVIVNCEVDFNIPIILKSPFLSTSRVLVGMVIGHMKFMPNDEHDTFNVGYSMYKPNDMRVMSMIDTIKDD
ncbi:uncharacterized protein LOC107856673 [Capsicum annuum]|uniref:uncharacterized protein LOC107856673 n=1 Tax=Capsicum annuum TaxID=4072 RepID=UPI001FB158D8|nr:uncharacterized protein LOC107856673 [Capsicum annuum]